MKAACISSHQNSIPSLGLSTAVALFAAVVLFAASGAHGAAITWGSATTISAATDVITTGALKYAYTESNLAASVNGVSFSAGSSFTSLGGGNVTLSGTGFTRVDNIYLTPTGISGDYTRLLSGGASASANATTGTVTLNNITAGHDYATQIWVNDSRGGVISRAETVTSTGGNTVTLNYANSNSKNSAGQFSVGRFVADGASQAFTLQGNANAPALLNAIQVRDVSASWSGTTSGTWANSDTTSSNFSGLNFTAAKAQSTVAVFGDTTTAGGAVSNYNLTVGAGGASTGTVLFENTTAQSYTIGSADSTGITGTTAITKTGNGTVTFTGSNTYTGATTINAGKLVLGDAAADNFATSGVTVGANGTLAGSGTLSGTLSVSGLLAPGNGGTGTLAAGTTTWNGSGGIWEFELTSPGASDKLDITGNFTKGSGSVFQFNFMNSTPLSGTYTLIDWSGSTAFLASNFSFTGLSSAYNGSYFTINGSQLDFTAVPEPTSALAGLLITAGLLRRRRA